MLNKLHTRLTFICTAITASILLFMHLIAFLFCEEQLNARSKLTLQNHLSTITSSLQTTHTLSQTWLAQMETTNRLIISVKEHGNVLLFPGSFATISDRNSLIQLAEETAQNQYGFNPHMIPVSKLEVPTITFDLKTQYNEHFLVGLCIIPSDNGAYSLTVLKDMKNEDTQILSLRLLFLTLVGIGITLLALFSFWFTKRTIAPVQESSRKQTEFIAAASHELRSPLAVLQASAATLHYQDPTSQEHYIAIIEKECKRMGRLVDDLLLLANADAKTWSIHFVMVEVDTLLINLCDFFSPMSRLRNISLKLILPEYTVPPLYADSERLEQVLTILLDNAFSYTPDGGHITLSLAFEMHQFKICVIDNGCGIPNEHKPHIFDRFYQVDKTRHNKEHFGLGLSIAYEIIQLHHGSLSLHDTPGGGCTFVIQIPQGKNAKALTI